MEKTSATRDELMVRLAALGIETSTVDHPPMFTVEDSQALRGELPCAVNCRAPIPRTCS